MDQAEFEARVRAEGYEPLPRAMAPDAVNPMHAHGFDAWLLILDGALTIVRPGSSHTYGPGSDFVVAAGERHEERAGPQGVRYIAARRSARPAAT